MMHTPEQPESAGDSQRVIRIPDPVVVRDLVEKLNVPAHDVIAALMEHNYFASLTAEIDFATAAAVCSRYGFVARQII